MAKLFTVYQGVPFGLVCENSMQISSALILVLAVSEAERVSGAKLASVLASLIISSMLFASIKYDGVDDSVMA